MWRAIVSMTQQNRAICPNRPRNKITVEDRGVGSKIRLRRTGGLLGSPPAAPIAGAPAEYPGIGPIVDLGRSDRSKTQQERLRPLEVVGSRYKTGLSTGSYAQNIQRTGTTEAAYRQRHIQGPVAIDANDLELDPEAWPKFEKLVKATSKRGHQPHAAPKSTKPQ